MTEFVLAGGCFWCLDSAYSQFRGIDDVTCGYTGGKNANPTYEQVCEGNTDHAEVVSIRFEESVISANDILDIFFTLHDPTQLNRQGNDIGTQYRSAIFTTTPEQMIDAVNTRDIYEAELKKFGISEIVTEIQEVGEYKYWIAEEYHQRYLEKNPNGYDCHSSTGIEFPMAAHE